MEIATSGNIALAHGLLTYGLETSGKRDCVLFGAGYPITPVNEIAEWGMGQLPLFGGEFIQAESELAAINMVLGAASMEIPAFTVTSSPGISLMQETISYAIGMESPLVVADVVRGGPGLGNIQGAQSDLALAISGGHGDMAPLVLAPATCQEMYNCGYQALQYAFRYRIPAFILSDGYVGQMKEKYRLKREMEPQDKPGMGRGIRTSIYVREGILNAHNWKLVRRFEALKQDKYLNQMAVQVQDDETDAAGSASDILIISYGIFSRIAAGVVERSRKIGLSVAQASLKVLSPFPEEVLRNLSRRYKALYVLEGSCGQLHELVRKAVGRVPQIGVTAYPGGALPCENEITEHIKQFSTGLTPQYLGWKAEADRLEEQIDNQQKQLQLNGGVGASRITLEESTYAHEIQGNLKKRAPRKNNIMTDVPFSYCAGCGETPAVTVLGRVLERLNSYDCVLYSPVGCSIFMYDYFKEEAVLNVQVPHGRGPAAASGSKRAEPRKFHIVVQGDGDALDIGLSELIHCVERGENVTLIIFNNGTYGMTGGQVSSATPAGEKTATTPKGRDPNKHGKPLDLSILLQHPGVAYYRRCLVGNGDQIREFESSLVNALYHQMAGNGTSVLEVFTACPSRHRPQAEFLQKLSEEGVKAKGRVAESIQYAARLLPPGERGFDVGWGDDVEDPYSELEKLRQSAKECPDRTAEVTERLNSCREKLQSQFGCPPSEEDSATQSLPDIQLFMGGIGGQGVQLLAEIMIRALNRIYPHFTSTPWYEPEVTKALTTVGVKFSAKPDINPMVQPGEAEILLAMNRRIIEERSAVLSPKGLLIYDSTSDELEPVGECRVLNIPLTKMARDVGEVRCANIVALGVFCQLLDALKTEDVRDLIEKNLPRPEINIKAFEAGIACVEEIRMEG